MASDNATKKWRWLAAMCGLLTFAFVGLFVMIGGAISKKTDGASWGIYLGAIIAPIALLITLVAVAGDTEPTASAVPTPVLSFAELKANANALTYEELYRNNETYQGDLVYLKGEVIQVVADGNSDSYELRVAITQSDYGYDDPVYAQYTGPVRLLEDDIVELVGNVKGLRSYRSVLGGRITIPEITNVRIQPSASASLPSDGPGASRENPIPLGAQIATHDGFSLWVEEVTEDAAQIILNENQFNDPPTPGNQFVMIRIKVKNNNPNPDNFSAGSRLRAVGDASVEYRQSGDGSCGVMPNEFESSRDLFEGGELSGNICFSVQSSDVASLVMYDEDGRDWIFIALR